MRQSDIVRLLGVAETTVSKAIILYKDLGHEGDRPSRGRKRTINTSRVIRQIIKKQVHRNPKTSMRKIVRDIGVSPSSMRPKYSQRRTRFEAIQDPKSPTSNGQEQARTAFRCRQLRVRAASQEWVLIHFTDEKLFTVEQTYNRQNDRVWSTKAPYTLSIVEHLWG
ncbi:unnamed protein product [Heligmosomoides polygyrus]|uniref:HTH_Tnp_Tc3_2 domain-containing protein n=1 Tax=Heligmosomoides polygyrus TaxID=6339 RepID=A0A183FX10_HELPZ|nr:unnamed protein product [Heligmosomoides polygyrus]